jgi:hypothetical protein
MQMFIPICLFSLTIIVNNSSITLLVDFAYPLHYVY